MRIGNHKVILSSVLALSLTACGGGSGGSASGIASTPTPPPPTPGPTPTPTAIISAANSSQQFAGKGATVTYPGGTGQASVATADSQQLKVRYDAASRTYEVQLPSSQTWQVISLDPNIQPNSTQYKTNGSEKIYLSLIESGATGYKYSALALWSDPQAGLYGGLAFGIPTPAGGVPTTGTATYAGQISGRTTETFYDWLAKTSFPGSVEGGISLSFNFGAGSLSGSISPVIYGLSKNSLGTLSFTNTVYSAGSTVFSGQFGTNLSGLNAFSGQFTGPQAQELIGSFVFPYTSPADGHVYQAGGGFVAK